MEFKHGDIIKVYGSWNGAVIDVYHNADGQIALEIAFAKDIVRSKPYELHKADDAIIEPSTWQAFIDEINKVRAGQDECIEELERSRQ